MKFSFTTTVRLNLEHDKETNLTNHVATDLRLDVSDNLDENMYLDKDDLPSKAGSEAVTTTLVQGLIGNIHMAHQNGFKDSAEHLRFIISELERGFVQIVNVTKSF